MLRSLRSMMVAALVGATFGMSGLAALGEPPPGGFAPDPPAHASRANWVFEIRVHEGRVSVDRVRPITFAKPAETPRAVGRFALELYIGRELLDRVRFNVPLMGGEATEGNRNNLPKPRFEQNVNARLIARMADNPRAAYLLVVDRETGDTQKFAWPPERDGRIHPWTRGLADAASGDFPDGGMRAVGFRDGGAGFADSGHD
jgi:hypothetical protein